MKESRALSWINELPCHAWFRAKEVPGPASTVNPLVSRLANHTNPPMLKRVAPGLYFKCHPKDDEYGIVPDQTITALIYAGAGAGLRKFNALNELRWTTQMSAKINVSSLRRIAPYKPYIRYTSHPNKRRTVLNWAEVTVLEALQFLDYAEISWTECVATINDGRAQRRPQWAHQFNLRRDKLLYVSEHERSNGPMLKYQINELCEAAMAETGLAALK